MRFFEEKVLKLNPLASRVRYKNSFRYIDDLICLNNRDTIYDINSIYPKELEITKTNEDPHNKCSFLDISIEIVDNLFIHKIYDKRREFNFSILGLPSFKSNVPVNSIYGVMCSQFCRFALVCKYREDFVFNCKSIISKLLNNDCPSHVLKKFVNKFKYNKSRTLLKYGREMDLSNELFM